MGPELLGQLLDAHGAGLVLYARQWCASPEDVVQEAFIKLAASRQTPEKVLPWLYRVVRNGAISAARSAGRRRRHESVAASVRSSWFVASPSGLDPETAAEALQSLPVEKREVIVAHLWGGLTFEQVGEVAGVSSSTAHRWYAEGLSTLRERLGVTCPKQATTPE